MRNIVSFKYDIVDKIKDGKRYRGAHVFMMCHVPKHSYDSGKRKKGGLRPIITETQLVVEEFFMTLEQLAVCANSFEEIYRAAESAAPLDPKVYKTGKKK